MADNAAIVFNGAKEWQITRAFADGNEISGIAAFIGIRTCHGFAFWSQ